MNSPYDGLFFIPLDDSLYHDSTIPVTIEISCLLLAVFFYIWVRYREKTFHGYTFYTSFRTTFILFHTFIRFIAGSHLELLSFFFFFFGSLHSEKLLWLFLCGNISFFFCLRFLLNSIILSTKLQQYPKNRMLFYKASENVCTNRLSIAALTSAT